MHVPSLIEKKRDGGELSADEISYIISNFTRGEIPDYQVSALAMAIFFRGMTDAETWHLTKAMLESGHRFTYPPDSPPKVDKHSTGAIGGKTSLVLAPLLACDELWVPMISGRGLDITGGTLDKLESIPGFDVNLDQARALKQLKRIGVFMIGQTAEICPADKKLYALRDVTGTVPSRALIVATDTRSFCNSARCACTSGAGGCGCPGIAAGAEGVCTAGGAEIRGGGSAGRVAGRLGPCATTFAGAGFTDEFAAGEDVAAAGVTAYNPRRLFRGRRWRAR